MALQEPNSFRWEIEFLKNITTVNLLLFSADVSSMSFSVRANILSCELSGKEIKNIDMDQLKLKSIETKQWSDHLQIKITLLPHKDSQYTFIQERWCEKLPQIPDLQHVFCKFCHQSFTPETEHNFQKVHQLPGPHWEEIKDSFWVCACNATALEQSPVIPKGFIRAQSGKLLLSNNYALIHSDNISYDSIDYYEKDKDLLQKIALNYPNFVLKHKPNEYEMKKQQWVEVLCNQCRIPVGLKEISCGSEFKDAENNFKFWKHKTITKVTQENHWKYRTIESMLSSDMVSCMSTHGTYRFHLKHDTMLITQIVVTNWSTFRMDGEDFGNDIISLKSIRPTIKFSYRDCYSVSADISEKFDNQWLTKYQIETLYYSLPDCFELLSKFHKNNKKLSPMCQEFSGMKNSWMYYLIDS